MLNGAHENGESVHSVYVRVHACVCVLVSVCVHARMGTCLSGIAFGVVVDDGVIPLPGYYAGATSV